MLWSSGEGASGQKRAHDVHACARAPGEREELVAFGLCEGRGCRHGVHRLILYGVDDLPALTLEAREDGLAVRADVDERNVRSSESAS